MKTNFLRVWRIPFLALALFLVTGLLNAEAQNLTINVIDENGSAVNGFRWLVEEDTTPRVTPGVFAPTDPSVISHRTYSPPVGTGSTGTSSDSVVVPDGKRYLVSVLPSSGYSIGGAPVAVGQASVTVRVNKHPLPTAQISVLIFEDNNPINGTPDLPAERGLEGFNIYVFDQLGQVSVDVFGNNLGTTYLQNPDGTFQLDADGNPIVSVVGNGIVSDANGYALIKNLPPGKYGIRAESRDGKPWSQTSTIEGTPGIDTWVKEGEPKLLNEFGLYFWHAFLGFVLPTNNIPAGGTGEIKGQFVSVHQSRPPASKINLGNPIPECWVGVNSTVATVAGQAIYAQPCGPNGRFDIPGVPPGTYQLVMWDTPLDYIIGFHTAVVPAGGGIVNLGKLSNNAWFGNYHGSVFSDANENGFRDPGEEGISNQLLNLRFRDGSIYQSTFTDNSGDYAFNEVFPWFRWLVAEVDYTRFKPTGATIVIDNGGHLLPGAENNPQPQPDVNPNTGNNLSKTETGPFPLLLEGMLLYADQTHTIDWGKTNYAPGDNGGIAGIIFYATTRAEDDPRFGVGEGWEPGIPRVQVSLYQDANKDGRIDDVNGSGTLELSDVDNYPFGWEDGLPKGAEDVVNCGDGVTFCAGDALNIAHSDSWDDNIPTGCIGNPQVVNGFPVEDCAETLRTWNQIRPAVFDGGYAFTSYFPGGRDSGSAETSPLAPGTYIVQVSPPPGGYQVIKEEDKNVEFGDQYIPNLLPAACVGPLHTVPPFLSIDGVTPAPFAGESRPRCNRKQVTLASGQNAAADFHLFTMVPKAGRFVGLLTNDLFNTFNPGNPNFSEKLSPPWIPISFKDFKGNEITRTYSDKYGKYEALLPSSPSPHVPVPTGVSPHMVDVCLNDPGPIPDPINAGQFITDPFYNKSYSRVCYTLDVWPAKTTIIDTPLVPISAFTGALTNGLDCEYPDHTPDIYDVSGPVGGPYVNAIGDVITITSVGTIQIQNPDYNPNVPGSTPTIARDYGFGSVPGTVTIGGTPLQEVVWAADGLSISGKVASNVTGQLVVTRSNGRSTVTGVTLHVGDGPVVNVGAGQSIQTAINNAAPGSIILIAPGVYQENLILWKPLTLQGSGARSTIIDASIFPPAKQAAWSALMNDLVFTGQVELVPGQRTDFLQEQGAGITAVAYEQNPAKRWGPPNPEALIDGLSIRGALSGGGIFVSGYAHYLDISNNVLDTNQGNFGGGIRLGWRSLLNATSDGYIGSGNDNINIHDNNISQNGSMDNGGGISLFNGSDNYNIFHNFMCGNFSQMNGAGISHYGLSNSGLIGNNKIMLNEASNNTPGFGLGGGIYMSGEAALGGAGALSPGTGSVTVNANRIKSNYSMSDGAGIAIVFANGQDVALNPAQPGNWHQIKLFNNMIVNNVAALAGGGISLQDAAKIYIIHDTIANNDSTATNADAFAGVGLTTSTPQGAGLISRPHTANLAAALLAAGAPQTFSDPVLANSIIYHNRSFYWDAAQNNNKGGLLPLPSAPVYTDLQVYSSAVPPDRMNPLYSVLSNITGYDPSNTAGDPLFVNPNVNVLQTSATGGEGQNFISVIFRPLRQWGNYHITAGSSAIGLGQAVFAFPNLQTDYDGQARPAGNGDSGADQFVNEPPAPGVKKSGSGASRNTSTIIHEGE